MSCEGALSFPCLSSASPAVAVVVAAAAAAENRLQLQGSLKPCVGGLICSAAAAAASAGLIGVQHWLKSKLNPR